MKRFVTFVLRHRWLVIAVVTAITVAAGAVVSQGRIASSIGKLFFGDAPIYLRYLERISQFGTDEVVLIGIEDVDVLAPDTLDKLEEAIAEIRAFEPVQRVVSVLDVQWIRGVSDSQGDVTLKTRSYASEARREPTPERRKELLARLQADPMASGLLVSSNGRHMVVIVELYPSADRSAEEGPALVDSCLAAFEGAGFPAERLHRAGQLAAMAEMIRLTEKNILYIFPLVGLVLLVVVWLLFRQLWPVLVSMGVSLIAVVWTMGIAVLIDKEISILHSITPIVILIVGFSDVIHLCSAYLLELSRGKEKTAAITSSVQEVGRACIYTSITTFFGFAGMAFVPTPAFRTIGITLGAGVGAALLIAVTLAPIIFSFMREPKSWRVGATGKVQDWLDRLLMGMARLATGRPWAVVGGFTVAFAAAVFGLTQLNIDASMTERLRSDNPVAQDQEWFKEHFAGTNFLEFYVEVPREEMKAADGSTAHCQTVEDCPDPLTTEDEFEGAFDELDEAELDVKMGPDGVLCERPRAESTGVCTYGPANALFEPELFHRLLRLQDAIAARADVDAVQSVVQVYETMHTALVPDHPADERVPTDRAGLAGYALTFEMAGGQDFERIVDFDRRAARFAIRLGDEALREAHRTGNEVAALGAELLEGHAVVESSGMHYLMGGWMDRIIAGQRRGLLFTFIAIAIAMMIGLRSLRVGLWSMVPNTLPLLMLGGTLGLLYDVVDSDTLILAMLAIGIGVDDTVHFMMRYKLESSRTHDPVEALRATYDFAGRAIVMTTLTLALGFAPMLLSEYITTQLIGALLPFTLLLALLADLLLVPALVALGPMKIGGPAPETES